MVSKGYTHSSKVKLMLSKLAKNRKLSDETKALISKSLQGELNSFFGKTLPLMGVLKALKK